MNWKKLSDVAVWSLVGAFIALLLMSIVQQACAHEWYPPWCCSGKDCAPVLEWRIDSEKDGVWATTEHGTVFIPRWWLNDRAKPSKDGDNHVCFYEFEGQNVPRCVFVALNG